MTSRLVLGAANYGRLTQAEVDKLLGTALELGINKIDTAHRYEDSEKKIGIALKVNKGFSVNTKACPYGPELFTPTGILGRRKFEKTRDRESWNAFCSLYSSKIFN